MKHLRRLGILAAATTLAGVSALAGAGIAGAQLPGQPADISFDSPSSLTVQRIAGAVEVSYANRSGRNLTCGVIVSNGEVIWELYQHYQTAELIVGEEEPAYPSVLQDKLEAAQLAGEFGTGSFDIGQGDSGPVTYGDNGSLEQPTSTTFAPEALAICGGDRVIVEDPYGEWATYSEIETSTSGPGAGGGELFGSLADLIPTLGS